MTPTPFQFVRSEGAVESLLDSLQKLGLRRVGMAEDYCRETWDFASERRSGVTLSILWERRYWPDGVEQEDERVRVVGGCELLGVVEVGEILRQRLSEPLRQVVAMRVASLCAEFVRMDPGRTFPEWLAELADEETLETWWFSPGCVPDSDNNLGSWRAFVERAIEVRGERVRDSGLHTSYLWHDEQASQLRLATSPGPRTRLPFGCRVVLADDPDGIIASWLGDPGFIPWEALHDGPAEEVEASVSEFELRVWAVEHTGT